MQVIHTKQVIKKNKCKAKEPGLSGQYCHAKACRPKRSIPPGAP
jgi:hypothetical protein